MLREQRAMTAVEVVVGMAVLAIIAPVVVVQLSLFLNVPPVQSDKVLAAHELTEASLWITRDAQSAKTFQPGTAPSYGAFTWTDYTGSASREYQVAYSYSGTNLVRTLTVDNVGYSPQVRVKRIANYNDVAFTWDPSAAQVTVDIKVTPDRADPAESTFFTTRIIAAARPRQQPDVAPPGSVPIPTPAPGSVTYNVAALPTILQGTYISGTTASLATVDNDLYVVSASGPPRTVRWEVQSQDLTSPSTISQIEVRYTGQATAVNTTLALFVKTTGGVYATSPDTAFTFTQANSNVTASVFLTPEELQYVNSLNPRVVTVKVEATNSPSFNLSTDQLIFIASP